MQNSETELPELLKSENIVDKAYEQVRLVDPIQRRVVLYKDGEISELQTQCFDFWSRGKMCDNCISMRALNENKTFVKIEYTDDQLFMITAVPIEVNGRRVVFELMKDATDSMVFSTDDNDKGLQKLLHGMINSMNCIAMKDSLTGIYNRRYINEKLPVDMINAELSEQDLSVIMADVDFFKKVNDSYGHLVGDSVLKSFTDALSGCIKRESDWIGRFGGEEFLICLPGAKLEKALEIAENMRKTVETMEVLSGGNRIKITSSFGIYSGKPKPGDQIENVILHADEKLYAAKNNGRNRVEY